MKKFSTTKKTICIFLSLIICFSVFSIAVTPINAKASELNFNTYEEFQAYTYATLPFEDYYVNTGSASYARNYYELAINDNDLMKSFAAWEAMHIATTPSYSLDSGLISKKDFYKLVLFDILDDSSSDGVIAKSYGDYYDEAYELVINDRAQYITSATKLIFGKEDPSEIEKSKLLTQAQKNILYNGTSLGRIAELYGWGVEILDFANTISDGIRTAADFCAISNAKEGTKEVLLTIYQDNSLPYDLRSAAYDCYLCIDESYMGVLHSIGNGAQETIENFMQTVINIAWDGLIKTLGCNVLSFGAKGVRMVVNYIFSQDEKIDAFYKVAASVNCEYALINAMEKLKFKYLTGPFESNAINYMRCIELYKNTVIMGYEYSIATLEIEKNSLGNYLCGIFGNKKDYDALINDIKGFKQSKIASYIKLENAVYNSFNSQSKEVIEIFFATDSYTLFSNWSLTNPATAYPTNASNRKLTYYSGNTSIATVDQSGKITPVNPGTVTIYAKATNGVTGSCVITILPFYADEINGAYTITKYVGSGGAVNIPSYVNGKPVVAIGEDAFYNCDNITSVTIPKGIVSIGEDAFYSCGYLNSVTIGNDITSIGIDAFRGCNSLTAVNTTDIGAWCNITFKTNESNPLYYAKKLYINGKLATNITIPDSVTSIGGWAFADCTSLTSVTIPNSVTSIGDSAFRSCSSLTSITIPDSITSLGSSAFGGCTSLTNATIGNSVTSIGGSAFYNCKNLTEITIPDSVTSIGSSAFSGCTNLTDVTIGNSVTSIGGSTFYNCKNLTEITIPDSVTSIGSAAFDECICLTDVTIGDGVTSIGVCAFSDCTSLTNITIGDSVTSIDDYAFIRCTSLTDITIPDSVTSLDRGAFNGCTSLTDVTIGNGVTNIGSEAFKGCISLTDVTIGNSLTFIDYSAFGDCTSLERVNISDLAAWCNIRFAGFRANPLYYAKDLYLNGILLTSINIPNNITEIVNYTFSYCTSLNSINIPDNVTSIGSNAFSDCTSLECINVSNGNKNYCSVDGILFSKGKTELIRFPAGKTDTHYILPENITSISSYAFYNCNNLTVYCTSKNNLSSTNISNIKGYKYFGDFNDDKVLNSSDLSEIRKTLLGVQADEYDPIVIDMNRDESFNILDLIRLKKTIAEA